MPTIIATIVTTTTIISLVLSLGLPCWLCFYVDPQGISAGEFYGPFYKALLPISRNTILRPKSTYWAPREVKMTILLKREKWSEPQHP